jgi:hypothetical protein
MEERVDWCFDFQISATDPIGRVTADKLLDKPIQWAEEHKARVRMHWRVPGIHGGGVG